MNGRAVLCSMLLAFVAAGSAALADGPARIVLLGPSEQDAIVVRLRQELGVIGVDVTFVPSEGPRDLAGVAKQQHAAAAMAVETAPPAVVLWIDPARAPDAASGPEIHVDEGLAGSREPRLLALRAVEILRGRLLPVPVTAQPTAPPEDAGSAPTPDAAPATAQPSIPPAPAPPPADAGSPRPAPPSGRGPSVFLGPAVLASPGGVGAMPHVWLGARWSPVGVLDLELVGSLPTTAATVSAPEGSMMLRAGAIVAGASARFTDPAARFFATAGAGLGAMLVAFSGQASPPFQAASGLRPTMLPYAHAAAGYWIAPRVALRADVLAGFALPQPVLTIAGQRAAAFGEPATLFAAAVEVRP